MLRGEAGGGTIRTADSAFSKNMRPRCQTTGGHDLAIKCGTGLLRIGVKPRTGSGGWSTSK